MKRYIIGLFLFIASVNLSMGQTGPDQFISNCVASTGPEAKYLKDFRIQLGQGTDENEFRFKAKIYLWKDTKYRFTMCTADNSMGYLIMNLKDEEAKMILQSLDPDSGKIYPYVDFACNKSGLYQICYDFAEKLTGSGIGIVSIVK